MPLGNCLPLDSVPVTLLNNRSDLYKYWQQHSRAPEKKPILKLAHTNSVK